MQHLVGFTRATMARSLRALMATGLIGVASPAVAQSTVGDLPGRPVSTYSIVARDSVTGELGVAVQSHYFSVGPIVAWAEPGVGAVATQSFVDPAYGPLGLDLMRMGRSAPDALAALLSVDENANVRQVAMVDATGRVAAHTGEQCIFAAGHRVGAQYSVQANLMDRPTVWDAMAETYETTEGDLTDRLLAALEAAEHEGGDIRGRQSAAILVVAPENTGQPWADRTIDLRVEDHPRPVEELRRLVELRRAYQRLDAGDVKFADGDIEGALAAYAEALDLVPDAATQGEAAFWVGVTLAQAGRIDEAIPYFQRAQAQFPRWVDLVPRLPGSGLLPDDPAVIQQLVDAMNDGP